MDLAGAPVVRIRTHVVTEKDEVTSLIARYTQGIAEPGDIVAIAETVVAITQGRAIDPESVTPSWIARAIARFAHPDASISAPRSMQMAIREVGLPKILLAAAAGLLGKIIRKPGLFFQVAGHAIAEIDDSGGTMPPYDRSIILGPAEPHKVARRAWRATGLMTLILDANDKGNVDILGSSMPLDPKTKKAVKELFRTNPFGNDDQRTPLVVVKARWRERKEP